LRGETATLACLVTVVTPSKLRIAGNVLPERPTLRITDFARTNGYLKRWYFDIGAHVKKGNCLRYRQSEVDQHSASTEQSSTQANLS